MKKLIVFLCVVSVCLISSCGSFTRDKKDMPLSSNPELETYHALALQGDVKAGIKSLQSKKTLSLPEAELRVKYQDRFVKKIKPQNKMEDPFVAQVVEAYQGYWNAVLTKEVTEREGFYLLFKNLNKVLKPLGKDILVYDDQRLEDTAQAVQAELERRGYHGLFGMTRPHLELMVWKKQKNKTYKIKIHDGVQKVNVVLLDKFKSLGWSAYATFGKSFTGGWATKEKLFCVKPAYNLRSEAYKVSYLKHEARHFADYKLFPKLKQPELEYRAKLTELIYADKTLYELIEKFRLRGQNTRVSPHAWANHHVYENLKAELVRQGEFTSFAKTGKEKIQSAALELLKGSAASLLQK